MDAAYMENGDVRTYVRASPTWPAFCFSPHRPQTTVPSS